jgi:hypothetical protein
VLEEEGWQWRPGRSSRFRGGGRAGKGKWRRRGGEVRVGSLFSLFFCLFFLSLFDLGFLVAKTLEKVSNVGVNKQNENGEKMEEHGSCVCFF